MRKRRARSLRKTVLVVAIIVIAAIVVLLAAGLQYWNSGVYGTMPGYGMMQYWSGSSEMQLNSSQLGSLATTQSVPTVSNNTLFFSSNDVRIVVLMGPMSQGQSMYSFVIDNITNPTLTFQQGARVTMFVINVDTDAYHSLTLTGESPPYAYNMMPAMMYSYAGSAVLPPTGGGMYAGQSVSFAVSTDMYYICAVPGHAQNGMYGRIIAT